ncbi:MAG: PEP-utilizing enzyme [bacterium]|nr:PEP-utilizing enzyme [bacterium]
MKVTSIQFKRKNKGGGPNWGAGLDYLLKDFWRELDEIVEDNYYGKHNSRLINFLFKNTKETVIVAMSEMKKMCEVGEGLNDWLSKAQKIYGFSKIAKSLSDKVIFIDTVTQFLRATTTEKAVAKKRKKIVQDTNVTITKKRSVIKGIVASVVDKKIIGKAKIILKEKDFSKLKRGDILITRETNQNFLPVMLKAAAFVTDIGGVLCHAAIVAREVKKACLVNTKFASEIIKDGDIVEIDTNKATIKILKTKV